MTDIVERAMKRLIGKFTGHAAEAALETVREVAGQSFQECLPEIREQLRLEADFIRRQLAVLDGVERGERRRDPAVHVALVARWTAVASRRASVKGGK